MHKTTNENSKHKSRIGRKIKITIQLFTLIILLVTLSGILYFYFKYGKTILAMQREAKQMVDVSTEDTFKSSQTSLVYDSEGNLISTLKSAKDAYYVKYEDIPAAAMDAMIVTEDRNFFEHGGVDYLANVRAAIELIKHKGRITQGASTITQQLARGVFLSQEVTYTRKIKEIFTAQEIEKKYSKQQIIEFYLNSIYFANGHYGLQAAAQGYFDKGVSSLSLSQTAFLCAIPNNPNLYNPLTNFDNTLKRRDRILKQMYDNGKINDADYEKALNEKIKLKKSISDKKNYVETYAYYCAIRALMKQKGFKFRNQFDSDADKKAYEKSYGELYDSFQKDLYVNGYRIYTSIDLEKQKLLQKSVDDALSGFTDKTDSGIYKMQGAAVCIDNDTGRVVAIVGGREQDLEGYTLNRAFQSYRQPGSSIKPLIVYTPSFERNYLPSSVVEDKYAKDGPHNADGKYLGKIRLYRAVELSKNTIAWKLFKELTPQVGLSYLEQMNFSKISDTDNTLASALGGLTHGVSPVEMASGYAALENEGQYREPTCIVKIMDSNGNEIVGDTIDYKNVYEDRAAKIMTEVLTGVFRNGTAHGLGLSHTICAGKTGTTNDKKDGWFCGYTPYYTTSVWVGCDLPKSISNLTGSSYPGTIWHNYMEQIHTSSMTKKFDYYDWRAEAKKAEEKLKQQLVTPTVSPDQTQFNGATPTEGTKSGDNQNTQDNTDISNNQDTSGSTSDNTDAGNESPAVDNPADTTGSGSDTNTDANSGTNSDGSSTGAGSSGTDSQNGQAGDNTAAAGNAGN